MDVKDSPEGYDPVAALLKATAERFAKLPLEAEPSAFLAEQQRRAS